MNNDIFNLPSLYFYIFFGRQPKYEPNGQNLRIVITKTQLILLEAAEAVCFNQPLLLIGTLRRGSVHLTLPQQRVHLIGRCGEGEGGLKFLIKSMLLGLCLAVVVFYHWDWLYEEALITAAISRRLTTKQTFKAHASYCGFEDDVLASSVTKQECDGQ